MILIRNAAFALPLLFAPLLARGQDPAPEEPLRYARISVDGARVRNLADDKGIVVAELSEGDLVCVHAEHEAGWLLVEVPGGYAVWVYGRYLQPTGEGDLYEVTSNAVNIRPRPSSEVTNFPLPQRLHAGDRVRLIGQADEEKPLAETWARVWSPPGVRAWLRGSTTEPLEGSEDGPALWAAALTASAGTAPAPRARATEAGAPIAPSNAELAANESREALATARALLETERVKESPNFGRVRTAFEAILADAPSTAIAIEARADLDRVVALEEAALLRAELELERQRRAEAVLLERERVHASARAKDPLGGVFLSRGVLLRRDGVDGLPRYVLRFGRENRSELICTSGRYDLEMFDGFEVGVQGSELAATGTNDLAVIEVLRLEVIARR